MENKKGTLIWQTTFHFDCFQDQLTKLSLQFMK